MRHGVKHNRLNRNHDHRKSLLNNLATSILRQGLKAEALERSVVTTITKAKVVRGLVERLITYAKKGDLSARRQAAKFVKDPEVLQSLFSDLSARYAKRAGGYTRVLKLAERKVGDNSQLAMITLVEEAISPRKPKKSATAKSKAPVAKRAKKKMNITKSEDKKPVAESASKASATGEG